MKNGFLIFFLSFFLSCSLWNDNFEIHKDNDFVNIVSSVEKQQMNYSENRKYSIYTRFLAGGSQSLYLEYNGKTQCINDNNFLKFDPVVNNHGYYAYSLSQNSTADSSVYIGTDKNEIKIDLPYSGIYKNLIISDNLLAFSWSRLYDDSEFLILTDLLGNVLLRKSFPFGYIQKLSFLDNNFILIEAYSPSNFSRNIYKFDISKNILSEFYVSPNDILLKAVSPYEIYMYEVCGSNNSKLLYNTYYLLYDNLFNNDFSSSNNHLGRVSWNEAYRLLALVSLYNNTLDKSIEPMVNHSVKGIMAHINRSTINEHNPAFSWAVMKYSLTKKDLMSDLVTDSLIYYALLKAVNAEVINSPGLVNKIRTNAELFFDYHESDFDSNENLYRIRKNVPYWADGIWAPFNYQSAFALLLLELYKITGNLRYKERCFELAHSFRNAWKQIDNRIIWHYWPEKYYAGWTSNENISQNLPQKSRSDDDLYEDVSHAGINIMFVINFFSSFGSAVFSEKDIDSINKTLNFLLRDSPAFPRFISGDTKYQSPFFYFLPKHGWSELLNTELQKYYLTLLPYVYPRFDSANIFLSYASLLKLENSLFTGLNLKKLNVSVPNLNNEIEYIADISSLHQFLISYHGCQ